MRYLVATLFMATSAAAHPAELPHGHGADWSAVVVLFLIGLVVLNARRKAVRVRK